MHSDSEARASVSVKPEGVATSEADCLVIGDGMGIPTAQCWAADHGTSGDLAATRRDVTQGDQRRSPPDQHDGVGVVGGRLVAAAQPDANSRGGAVSRLSAHDSAEQNRGVAGDLYPQSTGPSRCTTRGRYLGPRSVLRRTAGDVGQRVASVLTARC